MGAARVRGRAGSRLLLATLVAILVGSLAWAPATLAVDEPPVETATVLGLPPSVQVGALSAVSAAVTPIPDAGSVDFVDVTDPAHEHVLATAPVTTDGVAIAQVRFTTLGEHNVVARYGGTPAFAASASTTGGVTVQRYVVAPGEARLGAYAFNDAITAALRDPATGVTYVGGDFTELGLRTGPVAEVDPPGAGTGDRIDGSPDVVGRITGATPDDDGYLLFGDLVAVNGAAVPLVNGAETPIVRIGADNELDAGWTLSPRGLGCANYGGATQADLADLATMGNYVIVPFPRIRVDTAINRTSTGLGLLDRTTGSIYLTGQGSGLAPDGSACPRLWASIPPLPQVSGCTAQQCFADITTVTRDTTTGTLLVTYAFHRQLAGGGASHSLVMAGYDTAAGTRRWAREILGPDPVNTPGWVTSSAPLPGAFLLTGGFPIETAPLTWDHTTNTMLIDALTGATRQRWTVLGEVSLADPLGAPIASATLCLPAYSNSVAGQASVSPSQLASLGSVVDSDDTTTTHVVCTYGLDGGGHVVEGIAGQATLQRANGTPRGWPLWTWTDGGTDYLLGPDMAFDLDAGEQVEWAADPSNWASGGTAMLQVGDRLVLAGPFRFLHGTPARHLAALDATQEPLDGFGASLGTPADPSGTVTALALWSGRLVVAGQYAVLSGSGRDGLGAVDPVTGTVDPWAPDAVTRTHPAVKSLSVDPATDELYVAGASCRAAWWECPGADLGPVARYDAIAAGGALDPSFAPAIACNPAGNSDTGVSTCPNVRVSVIRVLGGDVFLGGEFTAVNGTARQGLARVSTGGTLRPWAPALFTQMDVPEDGELFAVNPHEILLDGDHVLIAGRFETWLPSGGGGGIAYSKSPLVAYSASGSTRVYPPAAGALTGPPTGVSDGGFDAAIHGSAIVVAVGRRGALVLDRATFKFDPTANPYLIDQWWANTEGVFAVADDAAAAAAVTQAVASAPGLTKLQADVLAETAAQDDPIVATIAGAIPRWGLHTAGNLLEVGLRAPDATRPVAFTPRVVPGPQSAVSPTLLPVVVSWAPALDTGSGLLRYEVQRSADGRSWARVPLSSLKTTTVLDKLAAGPAWRYRMRAVDRASNVSPWMLGLTFKLSYVAEAAPVFTYGGGAWTSRALAGAVGGSVRATTTKGAWARATVTARSVGIVMATGPTKGSVAVYVDGAFAGNVNLKTPAIRPARVVFARWLGAGTHTIMVKSLGAKRVDLDGLSVLR